MGNCCLRALVPDGPPRRPVRAAVPRAALRVVPRKLRVARRSVLASFEEREGTHERGGLAILRAILSAPSALVPLVEPLLAHGEAEGLARALACVGRGVREERQLALEPNPLPL